MTREAVQDVPSPASINASSDVSLVERIRWAKDHKDHKGRLSRVTQDAIVALVLLVIVFVVMWKRSGETLEGYVLTTDGLELVVTALSVIVVSVIAVPMSTFVIRVITARADILSHRLHITKQVLDLFVSWAVAHDHSKKVQHDTLIRCAEAGRELRNKLTTKPQASWNGEELRQLLLDYRAWFEHTASQLKPILEYRDRQQFNDNQVALPRDERSDRYVYDYVAKALKFQIQMLEDLSYVFFAGPKPEPMNESMVSAAKQVLTLAGYEVEGPPGTIPLPPTTCK